MIILCYPLIALHGMFSGKRSENDLLALIDVESLAGGSVLQLMAADGVPSCLAHHVSLFLGDNGLDACGIALVGVRSLHA